MHGLVSRPSLTLTEMRFYISGDVQNGLAAVESFRPQAAVRESWEWLEILSILLHTTVLHI
jgi:hypothetical protein